MAIGNDKARLVSFVGKDIANKVAKLAELERRSISSMIAILVEEAIVKRESK